MKLALVPYSWSYIENLNSQAVWQDKVTRGSVRQPDNLFSEDILHKICFIFVPSNDVIAFFCISKN